MWQAVEKTFFSKKEKQTFVIDEKPSNLEITEEENQQIDQWKNA